MCAIRDFAIAVLNLLIIFAQGCGRARTTTIYTAVVCVCHAQGPPHQHHKRSCFTLLRAAHTHSTAQSALDSITMQKKNSFVIYCQFKKKMFE